MAIYQIQQQSFAAIRNIGNLHKGAPKPERGPGKDLDCFRFTSDDPMVMAAFKAAYGSDHVKEIHVYLPYARQSDVYDYWYESWGGGKKLKYRCDGRNWVKWLLPDGKGYSREPKPCPICAGQQAAPQGEHKPTGRLALILPELLKAGIMGTVLLTTTSITDIYSLNSTFLSIAQQRADGMGEDLRGIEFILRRELRSIPTKQFGVQQKHVVVLEPVAEWIKAQIEKARASTLMVSPVAVVNPTTGEIMDDEPAPPLDPDDDDIDDESGVRPGPPGMVEDEGGPIDWRKDEGSKKTIADAMEEAGLTKEDLPGLLKHLGGLKTVREFGGDLDALLFRIAEYGRVKAAGQTFSEAA